MNQSYFLCVRKVALGRLHTRKIKKIEKKVILDEKINVEHLGKFGSEKRCVLLREKSPYTYVFLRCDVTTPPPIMKSGGAEAVFVPVSISFFYQFFIALFPNVVK